MKIVFGPEFEKSLKRMVWRERLAPINPREWYRRSKYFVQRGRRGYSQEDTWNTNDYIARGVIAFCEHQYKHAMGYPGDLKNMKAWHKILKEIEWLMHEAIQDAEHTPPEVMMSGRYKKRTEAANQLFAKYWSSMWD